MKILGIGEAVIDTINVVERPGTSWRNLQVVASDKDAGGPVVAALLLLAKTGHECTIITGIGRDADGKHLKDLLTAGGVTLQEHNQATTQVNTILVDERTGQREKIRGNVHRNPIKNLDPAFIQSFDLIVVDRHERQAFYEIIKHKKKHTKLVIDPSSEVSDFTFDMIRHADTPIVPVETLMQLSEGRSLKESALVLHAICNKQFIVTMGQLGSVLFEGAEHTIIPPLHIQAVNTLGAGDVYRGAFAFGLLQAWGVERCARFANDAAAIQCTKMGNAAVVPSLQEIKAGTKKHAQLPVSLAQLEEFFTKLRAECAVAGRDGPTAALLPFYERIQPA